MLYKHKQTKRLFEFAYRRDRELEEMEENLQLQFDPDDITINVILLN